MEKLQSASQIVPKYTQIRKGAWTGRWKEEGGGSRSLGGTADCGREGRRDTWTQDGGRYGVGAGDVAGGRPRDRAAEAG